MTYRFPAVLAAQISLIAVLTSSGLAYAADTAPATEDEKVLYAIGLALGKNLVPFRLTETELTQVQAGIAAASNGAEPAVALEEYGPKIGPFVQARHDALAATTKAEAARFLEEQGKADGATVTPSGIIINEMTAGSGESPAATSKVKVHYHGTLPDGHVFDSSVDRGEPAEFGLDQVIPCWTEAVQTMKVGGKIRVVCPADTAYGDKGAGEIPGGAALVFEIELLDIVK
ncbi:FKBP-type peptidyl-prolyl cis-trans isomerase FkpA [Hoeflea marina]|uniref:Peptidyl-prolyl cis-trans isomerase n=1 Tax=Hoeflea marina TaxID=274592 RepID=A0A317PGB3_9HYPH|nr:FKBP-type peptidyl-prolyl cis-trans isomerase [Hoeflea marina]PWV99085.1 FKBP-type peptidyl-prolyl cis-trans isomerase FkpA [Hoeflea marina]